MKILQTPSGPANDAPFSKLFLPRELADIAMLSALGWSLCLLVAIYFASAGPSYPGIGSVTLTAFP
jgi:hypothetical protein